MKILLSVNGSETAVHGVQFAIKHALNSNEAPEVHPLPGTVKGVADQAKQYHHDDAKVTYKYYTGVGEVGETVAHFVKDLKCDQVVIGTRGMSSAAIVVMGLGVTNPLPP
ncbi:MAG TPA: universal stress protein [Burkholderiales bacterium]|nr:universal stress protein [Burkholderiales bacterium]